MTIRIRGRIYEEMSGRGLSGVPVSNGESIVQTDAQGWYTLEVDPEAHRFLFVTVPDGFRPYENFFQSTSTWTASQENIHFKLVPLPKRANRTFAHIADTHVGSGFLLGVEKVHRPSGTVLAQDLQQLVEEASPAFILASGDLTEGGKLPELSSYREAVETLSMPVFSLFGGHDGNEERFGGEVGTTFTRNYEQILGPTYYSFDWGGRHFVLYPTEDQFFSSADRERKERWFWSDLTVQPSKREIVVVMHPPPRSAFLERLGQYDVRLVLYGHTHSSKVYSYGKIVVAATPSFCFGGIDTTCRGYRLVRFREDEVQPELRTLQHRSVPLPAEETPPKIPLGGTDKVLRLRWEHQLPVGCHRARPVCAGEQLLLSLQDEEHRGRAGVCCLNAQTGEFQWHTPTDASVRNSVAVASQGERNLYALVSITGRVVVMDTTSGRPLWHADLTGYPERWIYTSPVIADNTVYVGAKAGYAAYDLETGEQQWYTAIESNDSWSGYAGPQVYEDLLIVLVRRRGVLGLNRKDGTIAWGQKLAVDHHYPSPVVIGDLLVSGGDAKSLALLQARTGEIIWHQPVLSSRYASGLTVHADRIHVTTPTGEAQCYDLHSGQRYWGFESRDDLLDMTPYRRGIRSILAAPVMFRNHLLIGGCDGWLYVLDAESGECQSRTLLGSPITAAPCVMEDGFCVGTYEGRVFCFAEQPM